MRADSQYSSRKLRRHVSSHGMKPVIPYPSNQKPAEAEFLRIDKQFKTNGSERLKGLYRCKASAERAVSKLKMHLNPENHKVRGLRAYEKAAYIVFSPIHKHTFTHSFIMKGVMGESVPPSHLSVKA
jgi:hypothetical protein